MIPRTLTNEIENLLSKKNKIIIIYGPRQSGKTTLVKSILAKSKLSILEINADEKKYIDILSSRNLNKLKMLVESYKLLFIDEAQRIPDIGINLKLLYDNFPNLKIIATGSSSFELANIIQEPLTGRTRTFILYPISFNELRKINNPIDLMEQVNEMMIYGMYPEQLLIKNMRDKKIYLKELTNSYLYKDILELTALKRSSKIDNLLRLLAFQIGSQVSLTELGSNLGISKETVAHYIDLLEKTFVVFRLKGFSRNLRKEVTKMDKIYFYDLGVRNAIIDNFNSMSLRDDIGKLWENFIIAERRKFLDNRFVFTNKYFWRTYTGAELDYIEEHSGLLNGYEIKWKRKKNKVPLTWLNTYKNATFSLINNENFIDFISEKAR